MFSHPIVSPDKLLFHCTIKIFLHTLHGYATAVLIPPYHLLKSFDSFLNFIIDIFVFFFDYVDLIF